MECRHITDWILSLVVVIVISEGDGNWFVVVCAVTEKTSVNSVCRQSQFSFSLVTEKKEAINFH